MWGQRAVALMSFCLLVVETSGSGRTKRLVLDEMNYEQEILALKQTVNDLKQAAAGMTTTYIRWGRSDCPGNGSELVYKGFIGGDYYSSQGGGVPYLCLPDDPTWANYNDKVDRDRAYVYGTEYEMYSATQSLFGKNMLDQDASCAVCKSSRPNVLMIPARSTCYPGWTKEYGGYLMAMGYSYPGQSDYACVDADPEQLPHGAADQNGHLMYMVEARCGSLSCPPYVEGRELACVVCSK